MALLLTAWLALQDPAPDHSTKLAELRGAIADQYADLGEHLAGEKLFRRARLEFNNAVRFDPKHQRGNARLGRTIWNAETQEWELDPERVPPVTEERPASPKQREEYERRLEKLASKCASLAYVHGRWCAEKLPREPEKAAWAFRLALEFDPQHEDAHKKLRHERLDGRWLGQDEIDLRKEMKEGLARAPKGETWSQQTETERRCAWTHRKGAAAHVLIESPHLEAGAIESLVQHAEHAHAMFRRVSGEREPLSARVNLVILQGQPQHDKFVDAFVEQGEMRRLAKRSKGLTLAGLAETWGGADELDRLRDWAIHHVVMECSQRFAGGARPWIHEGLAYVFTMLVRATAQSHCTDMRGTGAGGTPQNYTDAADWPVLIRVWANGERNPDIGEVFKCRKLSELTGGEPVKAWSLCEFLATDHREKFLEFLRKARTSSEEKDEATFESVFGWTLEELDRRWRAYAKAVFDERKK